MKTSCVPSGEWGHVLVCACLLRQCARDGQIMVRTSDDKNGSLIAATAATVCVSVDVYCCLLIRKLHGNGRLPPHVRLKFVDCCHSMLLAQSRGTTLSVFTEDNCMLQTCYCLSSVIAT